MPETLADLRNAKGLTQEELGRLVALRLGLQYVPGSGQKRISRFERNEAEPSVEELRAIGMELGVDQQIIFLSIKSGGIGEARSVFEKVGVDQTVRSIMAVCCLSKSRARSLDDSFASMKEAIEQRNLTMCVFIPYPTSLQLPEYGEHADTLASYYRKVRKSVSEANLLFKSRISADYSHRVALYIPRTDLVRSSIILLPPIARQYSLMVEESSSGALTKTLLEWTPSTERDISRPLLATGVLSIDEQIEGWEAFFGDVLADWIAAKELPGKDAYWERVR
jgi:transcriptional regulator with XRE-family HTH domain